MLHDNFVDTSKYNFLEMLYLEITIHKAINTTKLNTHHWKEQQHQYWGPTTLLRATCAPLNHYFIFKIFLESIWYVFQKILKFFLIL
jgi:hypothetical protein